MFGCDSKVKQIQTEYTSTKKLASVDHLKGSPRKTDKPKTLVSGTNLGANTPKALLTDLSFSSRGLNMEDHENSSPLQLDLGRKRNLDTLVDKGRLGPQSCIDDISIVLPATDEASPFTSIKNSNFRISKGGWMSERMSTSPRMKQGLRKERISAASPHIERRVRFPVSDRRPEDNRRTIKNNLEIFPGFFPRNGKTGDSNPSHAYIFVNGKPLAPDKGMKTCSCENLFILGKKLQSTSSKNYTIPAPLGLCQARSYLSKGLRPEQFFSVDGVDGNSTFLCGEHSGPMGDVCVNRPGGRHGLILGCASPVAARKLADADLRGMCVNGLPIKQSTRQPRKQSAVTCQKGSELMAADSQTQRTEFNTHFTNAGGAGDEINDEGQNEKIKEEEDDNDDEEEEQEYYEDKSDEDDDDDDDYEGFEDLLDAEAFFPKLIPDYRRLKLSPVLPPCMGYNQQLGDSQGPEAYYNDRENSRSAGERASPGKGRLTPRDVEAESVDHWTQAIKNDIGTSNYYSQGDSASGKKNHQPLSREMMREYFKQLKRTYCCSEGEEKFIDALILRNSEGQRVYDRFCHVKFNLIRQGFPKRHVQRSTKRQGNAVRQGRDDHRSNQSSVK